MMSDTNRPHITVGVDVSLRDRIAAVHESHVPMDYAGYIECGCGTECRPAHGGIDVAEQLWAAHVADAVIAELGLHPDRVGTLTRYVTQWIDHD